MKAQSLILKTVFSFLLLPLSLDSAHACSCRFAGGFLDLAGGTDAVFEGTVLSHHTAGGARPEYMEIEVGEKFTPGALGKTVRIWGDNGYQCLRSIPEFTVGTTWVFAVDVNKDSKVETPEYRLSVCGEYAVRKEGVFLHGVLEGVKDDAKQQMVLVEFRSRLKNAIGKQAGSSGSANK